ncbi:hypothetical protein HAX54_007017 [Datura stramonium]|uniref:Uncharacterized protein n=1 Tax=Datura stramonium TaxID=4076 RepID=A0ABS8TCF9_DATST|nr:hypothetical protein [Datura stramonium]
MHTETLTASKARRKTNKVNRSRDIHVPKVPKWIKSSLAASHAVLSCLTTEITFIPQTLIFCLNFSFSPLPSTASVRSPTEFHFFRMIS